MRAKSLVKPALCAALLCLISPFAVLIGPIPLSLSTFGLYLTAALLTPLQAVGAVGIYLLLGAVGLPVFGGFVGGVQQFVAPTGGFLVGYAVLVWIAARCTHSPQDTQGLSLRTLCGFILGTVGCYACGVIGYRLYTDSSLAVALGVCVAPFLLGDLIKILAAWIAVLAIRKRIR